VRPIVRKPIPLYVSEKAFYSFFNSPYAPHRGAAVDIYGEPLSPVDGKIAMVRTFRTPRYREDAVREDYLILIDVGEYTVKILHVRPGVREGEYVHTGDPLGRHVMSGFFRPWTEEHMHVEVRRKDDAIRAGGGVPLEIPPMPAVEERIEVTERLERFSLARVRGPTGLACGGFAVDGGIPHYNRGWKLGGPPVDLHVETSHPVGTYIGRGHIKVLGAEEGEVVTYRCLAP